MEINILKLCEEVNLVAIKKCLDEGMQSIDEKKEKKDVKDSLFS